MIIKNEGRNWIHILSNISSCVCWFSCLHATAAAAIHHAAHASIAHHHLFYHFRRDYYSIDRCVSKVIFNCSWIRRYRYHFVLCYLYCSTHILNWTFAQCNGGCASYCSRVSVTIKGRFPNLSEVGNLMIMHSRAVESHH